MDDILTEGLEILDSDSVQTSDQIVKKSKKIASDSISAHKTHKNFAKKQKEAKNTSNIRFGLKQKYKENTRVGKIYNRGKPEERARHKAKIIKSLQRTAVETDLARWCKLTGSKYLNDGKVESDQEDESAFDDVDFEKFEKEYLASKQ